MKILIRSNKVLLKHLSLLSVQETRWLHDNNGGSVKSVVTLSSVCDICFVVIAHTVNYVGGTTASLVQLVASVWCTSV